MARSNLRHCLQRVLGAALLTSLLTGAAGESSKRQNALVFARVLSYERTLEQRVGESVGVAVVYQRGNSISEANADDWLVAFGELTSVKIKDKTFSAVKVPYGAAELATAIDRDGVDVLLACDGLADRELDGIAQMARSRHVLTASNSVANVEKNLTLCVVEEAEKPKIFVNLNNAQLEGIMFNSSFLKLATLVH